MRQLLAPLPADHSDASGDDMPFLALQAADWDALEAICAKLDESGGSQTFNSLDYTRACTALQIGPSSVWFSTYRVLAEEKLGRPLKWTDALVQLRRKQMRLQRLDSSRGRYNQSLLADYFRKWRKRSSEENILMAKCYVYEVNTILAPIFGSWRAAAQTLCICEQELEIEAVLAQYSATLNLMARATAQVARYSAESTALARSLNPGFATLTTTTRRLESALHTTKAHSKALWFRKWLAATNSACRTKAADAATKKACLVRLRQVSRVQAQNLGIAVDLDRYNTLAPCLGRIQRYGLQLASAQQRYRAKAQHHEFYQWNKITHLQQQAAKTSTKWRKRSAIRALGVWRQSAPLQAKAMCIYAETTARNVFELWRLDLKCTLLRDSWQYQQVQAIIKYWYLKCSSEVYIQYQELQLKQRIMGSWRSKEQKEYAMNTGKLAGTYYPRWASASFDKMQARLGIIRANQRRAETLERRFRQARGVGAMRAALGRAQGLARAANRCYATGTKQSAMRAWRNKYHEKFEEILDAEAGALASKFRRDWKQWYLGAWRGALGGIEVQEKRANTLFLGSYLRRWQAHLGEYRQKLGAAGQVYYTQTKRLLFSAAAAVQDQIQDLNTDSIVFDEIRTLQAQQTIMRRMQMRMVRYRALETEAVKFAGRKKKDSIKYLMRHWYSRALNPHIEPMTPRSARRLPPSALRKIVLESKRPPSSPAGADTPTRANRRLFRPTTG